MHARINLDQVYATLAGVAPFEFTLTLDGEDYSLRRLANAELNRLTIDNSAAYVGSLFTSPPAGLDDPERCIFVAQAIAAAYAEYFKKKSAISRQAIAEQLRLGPTPTAGVDVTRSS